MTTRGAMSSHDIYNSIKAATAIGGDTISVRDLFKSHYEAADRSCWVITSNENVPLPIEEDDRRFMVIETPAKPMSKEWYAERAEWIEAGGWRAVVGWLQRRWDEMDELDRRDMRSTAPMTQAKRELIEGSADGLRGSAIRHCIAGIDEPAVARSDAPGGCVRQIEGRRRRSPAAGADRPDQQSACRA